MNKTYTNKFKSPELLSPVGGWKHLVAAVNNGADAVYMGGTFFNARIFAKNFDDNELIEAIDFAHQHNVKVYITLNTLINDAELVRAFEYVNKLYSYGADALIIQDMGLARLIKKYLPEFSIHLSTQGTIYNKHAIESVKHFGFSRIVPARELSIDEIKTMCEESRKAGIEVETFVHGALCMCYSGQCQMSRGLSSKGDGRSGNRGTCAQPCRQLYTDDKGNISYALSPKDICYLEYIPELIEAGVNSFKIEGRIKTPEYVAVATKIYRKYIDKYIELRQGNDAVTASETYQVEPNDMLKLKQIFNRGGFCDGYLHGNLNENLLSGKSPKNEGLYLGKVVAIIDNENKVSENEDKSAVRGALKRGKIIACVEVQNNSNLLTGDGVEFHKEDLSCDANPIGSVATYIKKLEGNLYLIGDFDRGVAIGDLAYKVTDSELIKSALSTVPKKLPISFVFTGRIGQYLSLVMTDIKSGFSTEIISDFIVEKAVKTPTDKERVIEQLCRLGNSPFTANWTNCDILLDENAMVPVSIINKMRREATEQLIDTRTNEIRNQRKCLNKSEITDITAKELLGENVLDIEQYKKNLQELNLNLIPIEVFMDEIKSGKPVNSNTLPYILNVSKGNLDDFIEKNFSDIVNAVEDYGILIGNLGWIKEFQDAGVKVFGDYGLNIFNHQAELAYEEIGMDIFAISHETGICDSRGLPLMITEHPIDSKFLIDRKNKKHDVRASALGDKFIIL